MKTLSDLPHFTASSISSGGKSAHVAGCLDRLDDVAEGRCWLLVRNAENVVGSLAELDTNAKTAVFITAYPTPLTVGMTLPYIDGYWRTPIVEMILGARSAQKRIFKPQDAVMDHYEGGRILEKAATASMPDRGTRQVVKGGWDHEHCGICWAHIDPGQIGYADDDDHWLCEDCYQSFVIPHDLSFMEIHGRRWPK